MTGDLELSGSREGQMLRINRDLRTLLVRKFESDVGLGSAEFELIRDFEVYLTSEQLIERARWLDEKMSDFKRFQAQVVSCVDANWESDVRLAIATMRDDLEIFFPHNSPPADEISVTAVISENRRRTLMATVHDYFNPSISADRKQRILNRLEWEVGRFTSAVRTGKLSAVSPKLNDLQSMLEGLLQFIETDSSKEWVQTNKLTSAVRTLPIVCEMRQIVDQYFGTKLVSSVGMELSRRAHIAEERLKRLPAEYFEPGEDGWRHLENPANIRKCLGYRIEQLVTQEKRSKSIRRRI
jgi:hypothetical protein